MPDSKKDFFISYTGRDVAWAEWIAFELEEKGYTTVVQAWDFAAGRDFLTEMNRAVLECERLLPVFSPAYFDSPFARRELNSFTALDGDGSKGLVIPVLVAPVADLGLFRSLVYIDISTDDETSARDRLLARIKEGRAKPARQRAFPGGSSATTGKEPRPFPRGPLPPNNFPKAGIVENPGFVGRADELARLHAALGSDQTAALTQALVGDGGFGKTEIARAYCFRHGREYEGLWWVDASRERHNLATEQLARALGIELPAQVDFSAVRRELAALLSEKKNLLILDNVDEPSALRDWRVAAPARRLITTRLHGPELGVRAEVAVDVLPAADARALLVQHRADLREGKDAALDAIAAVVGHHALAVALAGAYLGQHPAITVERFLEKLRDERSDVSEAVLRELNPEKDRGEDYARSVFAALSLHIEELAGTAAERVLEAAAFLHPAGIALDLLAEVLAESKAWWPKVWFRKIARKRWNRDVPAAVDELVRRSVVRLSGDASLHRLTQRVMRVRLEAKRHRDLLRAVLVVLARRLADAINPMKLGQHAPFIPHAEAALELAEKNDLHAEAGDLALVLGNYRSQRAEHDAALGANFLAEKHFRIAFGPAHYRVATATGNRGVDLSNMGDLDGALACYQEAERISRAALGNDHPNVAKDVNNRGDVLRAKGDLDGALACFQEAERIDRAAFGDNHPKVAIRVNNRGNVLYAKGDLDGALACFREAERIEREASGHDHPQVAIVLSNRGNVLQKKGDLDGALACFEEAERICRAVFGADNPKVAITVNNRGEALRAKGDLDGAVACFREAFSICLRKLGPRAEYTLAGTWNLAARGVDPVQLAAEIAGPEVAAELARHYQAFRERQG